MERITTTSSRRADPTSFLTGKIQCDKSAPTGKSAKMFVFFFNVRLKDRRGGGLGRRCCMLEPRSGPDLLRSRVVGWSLRRSHPLSPSLLSCQLRACPTPCLKSLKLAEELLRPACAVGRAAVEPVAVEMSAVEASFGTRLVEEGSARKMTEPRPTASAHPTIFFP